MISTRARESVLCCRQPSHPLLTPISLCLSTLCSGTSLLLSTLTVFLWDYQPRHFLYYPLTHPYILLHTLSHTSYPSHPAATCAPQWRTEWFGK